MKKILAKMKKFLYLSWAIVSATLLVSGFNLENRLPIWKDGPANSYFGYSIASHVMDGESQTTKWLVF